MTWTAPIIDRAEPKPPTDERTDLETALDWQRETLLWKCQGLTGDQLASLPLPTTRLSLLGLLRHLALVERWWFRICFGGDQSLDQMWSTDDNPDGDFHDGTPQTAEADYATFRTEVELAKRAAAGHDLEETFERRARTLNLRWVYLHMIEEYARHLGHADMLREAIDGATGE